MKLGGHLDFFLLNLVIPGLGIVGWLVGWFPELLEYSGKFPIYPTTTHSTVVAAAAAAVEGR